MVYHLAVDDIKRNSKFIIGNGRGVTASLNFAECLDPLHAMVVRVEPFGVSGLPLENLLEVLKESELIHNLLWIDKLSQDQDLVLEYLHLLEISFVLARKCFSILRRKLAQLLRHTEQLIIEHNVTLSELHIEVFNVACVLAVQFVRSEGQNLALEVSQFVKLRMKEPILADGVITILEEGLIVSELLQDELDFISFFVGIQVLFGRLHQEVDGALRFVDDERVAEVLMEHQSIVLVLNAVELGQLNACNWFNHQIFIAFGCTLAIQKHIELLI